MSAADLAEAANVHANTISRLELGGGIRASSATALRAAFEARGVTFIDDNEASPAGGAGLRFQSVEAG